jgi:hypothetical protein
VVRDVRFPGQRYGNDLLRLVVVKRLKDKSVEIFDVVGSATVRGGLSGSLCQVVS